MSEIDDIRTIAKTKELMEKLDKLNKQPSADDKIAIAAKRSVAYTVGGDGLNGGAGTSSTAGTGTGITGATDATGAAVAAVNNQTAPPTSSNSSNAISGKALADFIDKQNAANASSGVGGSGGRGTDLSNAASRPASGGSAGITQGSEGTLGPLAGDVKKVSDASKASGATPEQTEEAVHNITYSNAEPGVFNIREVMNGTAGPKIYVSPTDQEQLAGLNYQVLKAVTGMDPDDPTLGMIIRFDGKFGAPTLQDQLANGFLTAWTTPFTPPPDSWWQLGKMVVDSGDSSTWASGEAWFTYAKSVIAISNPTIKDLKLITLTGSPPGSGSYAANSIAAGGVLRSGSITGCIPSGGDVTCPLTVPSSQKSWPTTRTYALSASLGKFITSVFDSEVPPKYQHLVSQVKIKDINGNVTTISPAINGGVLFYDASGVGRALYYDSNMALRAIVAPGDVGFYLP